MKKEHITKKIIIDKRETNEVVTNNKTIYKEEITEVDLNNRIEEEMIIKGNISPEETLVIKRDINNYFLYS